MDSRLNRYDRGEPRLSRAAATGAPMVLSWLIGCACGLLSCSTDKQPSEPCENDTTRCDENRLLICTDNAWVEAVDCSALGGRCFMAKQGATCIGEQEGGVDDAAIDDASSDVENSELVPDLLTPEETVYEKCEQGQAYNPTKALCTLCPFSKCDGPGEDGLFEGTTLDGKCVCRTLEGYYWPESGLMAVPCDKDNDGWLSIEARSSVESRDRAYKENARCRVRYIDRFVLEAEGSADGEGHVVKLIDIDETVPSVPLYEVESLDDVARLDLHDKIKTYGGTKPSAGALNSLTKACVDPIADYNGNEVPDVEEWDEYAEPVELWRSFPELRTYTRFSFFTELNYGWFVLDSVQGHEEHGSYHIRERSRLKPASEGGIPLGYFNLRRGDDVRWYEHAEHWKVCDRQTDAAFSVDRPARGMDFARYNQGLWNLSSKGGTGNLLINGDGEALGDIVDPWTKVDGPLERVRQGECGAPAAQQGESFFALGGLCQPAVAHASAIQEIDLPAEIIQQTDIGESVRVAFGGYLRNRNGVDRPALQLRYFRTAAGQADSSDDEIGQSELLWSTSTEWTSKDSVEFLPKGTRSIVFELTAQRLTASNSNDAFFDGLYLRILSSAPNLIVNPGAEFSTKSGALRLADDFTGDLGPIESATDPDCGVQDEARSGRRFFAVGGCGDSDQRVTDARGSQTVSVVDYAADVDQGNLMAWFGGWVRAGEDNRAEILLEFLDDAGNLLDSSPPLEVVGPISQWRRVSGQASVPINTRAVRVVMLGHREPEADVTAVFDDLFLRLSTGARMFHHSQFKCVYVVETNDAPEEHPQRVELNRLASNFDLNSCRWFSEIPPEGDTPNPSMPVIACRAPEIEPQVGTIGLAAVKYLHYPLLNRPVYERGCVNECLAVAPDCSGDADDSSHRACKTDREFFGTTYCDCAGGYTPWPECDECSSEVGNWDPDEGCLQCRTNWDLFEDCTQCIGNWDPEQDCTKCRNHFRNLKVPLSGEDIYDNCGTCPDDDEYGHWTGPDCNVCSGNWDIESDCLQCAGNWDRETQCEQCLPNFDPSDGCESCLGNWDGEGCAECLPNFDPKNDCAVCLPNYRLVQTGFSDIPYACVACEGNWDPSKGCTTCLPGWDEDTLCTSCREGYELFESNGLNYGRVCIPSNLLSNGGAEELAGDPETSTSGAPTPISTEPSGWTSIPDGAITALYQGHCPEVDNLIPMEGIRFFSLGGACTDAISAPACNSVCSSHFLWWCVRKTPVCPLTPSTLWSASQVASLEDIYAMTSDPEVNAYVRVAAWVKIVAGLNPNAGLPMAVVSVAGYRPDGNQSAPTFGAQRELRTRDTGWNRVSTEPIKVGLNTYSILFRMGAYLTPGGTDRVFFDGVQLRVCFEDHCCIENEEAGQLNCCNRNAEGGWTCETGTGAPTDGDESIVVDLEDEDI